MSSRSFWPARRELSIKIRIRERSTSAFALHASRTDPEVPAVHQIRTVIHALPRLRPSDLVAQGNLIDKECFHAAAAGLSPPIGYVHQRTKAVAVKAVDDIFQS